MKIMWRAKKWQKKCKNKLKSRGMVHLTQGKGNEKKDLLYYVKEYREGNRDVLNELILYRYETQVNNQGKTDKIRICYYSDKILNNLHDKMINKYKRFLGADEVRNIFLDTLYKRFEKINYKEKTVNKIIADIKARIKDALDDELEKIHGKKIVDDPNSKYDGQREHENISESSKFMAPKNDYNDASYYDDYVYCQYRAFSEQSDIREFLKYIDVADILSPVQKKIYELKSEGYLSDEEINLELGRSENGNISDEFKVIKNKLAVEYDTFKQIKDKLLTPLTKEIINFLNTYDQIKTYSINNSFDYFGHLYNFIKTHYSSGEQDISFHELHKNKPLTQYTLFDLLTDSECMHKQTWSKLYKILEDDDFNSSSNFYNINGIKKRLDKKSKDTIVLQCIKAFNKYLMKHEKSVYNMITYVKMKNKKIS